MFGFKLAVWVVAGAAMAAGFSLRAQSEVSENAKEALRQLDDSDSSAATVRASHWRRNAEHLAAPLLWLGLGALLFASDFRREFSAATKKVALALAACAALANSGCYRPFEPVVLETIGTSEEGFLIPYQGNSKDQTSTNSEEYLAANLVQTKQVRIPQQWVPKGFEVTGANGDWKPAAILIRVDKAPVTREWTADTLSGTANKNEAVWVMTSDQVEFSTGWTITARIASRDDAVKFLHNYPAGSLKDVLDTEARAKLQAVFGLEVTDLGMDELRKSATPHINKTTESVTAFFKQRGITITNLGITGGFVYKNPLILETMAKVFNAEQDKAIAAAATAAQEEKNKQIFMEAEGQAKSILMRKRAEADGIKSVADAKAYEIEKAKENLSAYITLKRIELEKDKLTRWDGHFPTTFMGAGGSNGLDMLLQIAMPVVAETDKAKAQ